MSWAFEADPNLFVLSHVLFLFAQDTEKLADSILKSVLTLSTVYYWLPKSQGKANWPSNRPGISCLGVPSFGDVHFELVLYSVVRFPS